RDAKQGIFLPFLTPLYNQVVFHGLVLPDAKITDLQAAFFGAAAAKSASVLLRSRNSDDNGFWTATDRPDHTVALDGVQAAEHPNGTAGTAELLLTMRNAGSGSAEYVGSIHLPEGVYVTGFALKIGDDFVPARIVERKTAQWVYEKITQIHRDPGLLTFTSRTDLSLKIAPFGPGQVRQARLQITYARTAPQVITFDSAYAPNGAARKTVPLGAPSTPAPLAVTTCATGAGSVAVADMADATRWQIRRTPYLNILIDCSRGTAYSDVSLANAIAQARQAFPDAKLARVTAINFEARDIMPNLVPVGQLNAADIRAGLLPDRGGLLQDRFLKRGLLLAHDLMQTAPDQARLRPQFVLISSLGQPGLRDPGLADFLQLVPDACVILAQNGAGIFHGEDPVSHQVAPIDDIPPVLLWNWDGHCEASAAQPRALVSFPGELSAAGPQIYDPQRGQFTPAAPVATIAPDTRFADGVRTWAAQDEAAFNPSLLKNGAASLIGLSKRTGILIPDSSYIAVESMAQWRLLEEKEKQKLANKQVFELEEPVASPEPATWLLLGLGLVVMILTHRRQKFTPRSARPPSREQSAPPLEPLPRSLA
ncbi:MAG TPA: VIT domain-containing protein, partial [Candidatus Methylacidiphilales bacterium]|nr:VIT domain-containing protein [Candidatus Methylacidiphilales bacterium]